LSNFVKFPPTLIILPSFLRHGVDASYMFSSRPPNINRLNQQAVQLSIQCRHFFAKSVFRQAML